MAFVPNPHVPYVGPVRGVSPGVLISVSGRPTPQAKWFAINLQCGASMNPRDDIALHISPRFDGPMSKVVRNSLQGGQWGIEENFGHFPFAPDAPFEILILVDVDMFKIAVNGQHFTEFRHRLPLGRINTVAVDGDVTLQMIRYEGGDAGIPQDAGFQHQTSAGSYGMPMPTTTPTYGSGSGSHLPPPAYGAPHNTSGYGTSGLGYSAAPGSGYSAPGYSVPGSGYSAAPGGPPGYSSPPGGHTSYPMQSMSMPMAVPGGGHSPGGSRRNEYLKIGGAGLGGAALGALGGFAAGRLTYPGHGGIGHGGMGMMHGKKAKKMKKHGGAMGQFPHKLKHHKMKHGKMKKHKKGSSSSSSSSSSEEE